MPCSPRKARMLIIENKATVISRSPFTIKLKYGSAGYKQELTLGVDTGHSKVGLSIVSKTKEVFSAIATLRNDISNKITTKKIYRRARRGRLRHRKPRFLNRNSSIRKGRLAPSIQWKIDTYVKLINKLKFLMPITNIVLETGTFDMNKLNNPDIKNHQYQKGVKYGFENTKAYILTRDDYKCQCGKKGCVSKLEVHHIIYRSNGGTNNPNNLITLCSKHHKALHDGKFKLNVKKQTILKAATTMNVIRTKLLNIFPGAIETFGYVTKTNRYKYDIEKTHTNDAFVIAGGKVQERESERSINFKRKNNRSIQKNRNGFATAIRRQRYKIQPKDIIKFEGKNYVSIGIQNKGAYLKIKDGLKTLVKSVKKIEIVFHQKGIIFS